METNPTVISDTHETCEGVKESVEIVVRAKTYLDGLPKQIQNAEYIKIVDLVNSYIDTFCKHNIIQDTIDLGPETSKTIFYCETCYKTFDDESGRW
jgi:hypothetical protein